ncbi:MAG: ABC transporter permease [Acidimicrobiales bacterium]
MSSEAPVIDDQELGLVGEKRGFSARSLIRWEGALVLLFIFSLIYGGTTTTDFFSKDTIFFAGINFGLIAIMALPEMLIITTGEIDLSVAAMLGLACATFGYLFEHHVEIFLAMLITLGVGALGGALNGFLITRLGLPSIAVTIGTLTMFRGLAEVILGTNELTNFGGPWTDLGTNTIPGTPFAWVFGIFVVLALIYGIVLHFTSTGRSIFAIGLQQEAAFFSGIRVKRIKFNLYLISGIVCAFTGLLYTYQTNTSRYDAGTGLELNVVAIVLFGGVSIFGGRGTMLGVFLSVIAVGTFDQVLTIKNVSSQEQSIVFGVLLLASVVVPNLPRGYRAVRQRLTARSAN